MMLSRMKCCVALAILIGGVVPNSVIGDDLIPTNDEVTGETPVGPINIRSQLLEAFLGKRYCPDGFNDFLIAFKYVGRVQIGADTAFAVEQHSLTYALSPRRSGSVMLFDQDGEIRGGLPFEGVMHCSGHRIYYSRMQGVHLDFGDEFIPGNGVDLSIGWFEQGDDLDWIREQHPGTPIRPVSIPDIQVVLPELNSCDLWDVMLRNAQENAPEFDWQDRVIVSFKHIGELECDEGGLQVVEAHGVSRELPETKHCWLMLFSNEGRWIISHEIDPEIELAYCEGSLIYLYGNHDYNGRCGNSLLVTSCVAPLRALQVRHFGVFPQDIPVQR